MSRDQLVAASLRPSLLKSSAGQPLKQSWRRGRAALQVRHGRIQTFEMKNLGRGGAQAGESFFRTEMENMFRKMQYLNHCLRILLQLDRPLSNILRSRGHDFELPIAHLMCINDLSS